MELIDKAKTSNDFGLRKQFPWTSSCDSKPWTNIVTEEAEKSFVEGILFPIFLTQSPTIRRVENPYLWARYLLNYEELQASSTSTLKEHHVIHATSWSNAMIIAESNFDWRCVRRGRFGQGVSFAMSACYAHKYASGKNTYIIAGVPIANKHFATYSTLIPNADHDTTTDLRGNVYVKYYDNDFYPYYIVQ